MSDQRNALIAQINSDEAKLVAFLSKFLRIVSPNPPGDTRDVGAFVSEFLKSEDVKHDVLQCHPEQPNIAATFDAAEQGRHLTLNGHIDVFPVNDEANWTHGPWSGEVAGGYVWGRGAVDMKAGTTASIFTYVYLSRLRDSLKGRLSLTVVSDEETLGSNGTRFLLEQCPELRGDCCLNGEPSGAHTVRFGEKGLLWLELRIQTGGGHGAYPHLSRSANKIAAQVIQDLEQVTKLSPEVPADNREALVEAYAYADRHLGTGAGTVSGSVVVNIGQIQGGLKINVLPALCTVHVDIRLPMGVAVDKVKAEVAAILSEYPEVEIIEIRRSEPNLSPAQHPLNLAILENARQFRGNEVQPGIGLGASDARIWRELDIPVFIHGPSPKTMGARDERIEIKEFMDIVRIHCLSAYDYLMGA